MKKILALLTVLTALSIFTGCSSTKEIPTDLTCAQLFQKGQNAYSNGYYDTAEQYYLTAIIRYGTDTQNYIEGRYELGHLYIKTKKYKKAFDNLMEVIDIFDGTPAGVLQGSYKKLANIELKKIPEAKLKEFQAARNKAAN